MSDEKELRYTVYRSETFTPRVELSSRYSTKMVNPQFYGINIHQGNESTPYLELSVDDKLKIFEDLFYSCITSNHISKNAKLDGLTKIIKLRTEKLLRDHC